jgi:hypothetical protein
VSDPAGPGGFAHVRPSDVHDFRNSGSVRARFLLISCPAGLDSYFEDMAALGRDGTFSDATLNALRLKYDIDEVEMAWGV